MTTKSYEKMIEEIGNMSVFELADFVKALETKFGVSAAAMTAGTASKSSAEAAPAEEAKAAYKVTLQNAGSEKIKTIKALREVMTTLTLSDAKAIVDGAPKVLADSMAKEEAEKLKTKLEAAGAKVELA